LYEFSVRSLIEPRIEDHWTSHRRKPYQLAVLALAGVHIIVTVKSGNIVLALAFSLLRHDYVLGRPASQVYGYRLFYFGSNSCLLSWQYDCRSSVEVCLLLA
jgi:hypothetical protein